MGEYSYSYKAVYNGIMVIVKIPTKQDLNVIAREDLRARLSLTRLLMRGVL